MKIDGAVEAIDAYGTRGASRAAAYFIEPCDFCRADDVRGAPIM